MAWACSAQTCALTMRACRAVSVALDMHIVGALTPTRLTSTVDATSESGLVALSKPMHPSRQAPRHCVRVSARARGSASWTVHAAETYGPRRACLISRWKARSTAMARWNSAQDISPATAILKLSMGGLKTKLTGVPCRLTRAWRLINVASPSKNFTASGRMGRLTATGGSTVIAKAASLSTSTILRVADRPDARAVASGELTLAARPQLFAHWRPKHCRGQH